MWFKRDELKALNFLMMTGRGLVWQGAVIPSLFLHRLLHAHMHTHLLRINQKTSSVLLGSLGATL